MSGVAIFRALGDETRYKIVSLLAHSDSYVELLAEQLHLTPGTVCHHLKKLETAGVVKCVRQQFYIIYSLNREVLELPLMRLIEPDAIGDEAAYRARVLSSFFRGEQLLRIPVQEKKRRIVLAELMRDFTGEVYEERQVNEIILRRYEDPCTLRRWLVSDGFMTRADGVYTVVEHDD